MKSSYLTLVACLAFSSASLADVAYDENGVGFVGKGDLQTLYDWNNSMLQDNAESIGFRLLSGASASWTCTGVNPAGKTVTQSHSMESEALESDVTFSVRKNQAGQVTGFTLNGVVVGSTEYESPGTCNTLRNWLVQPSLDEGSLTYEGGDAMLQVSVDGQVWFDLPPTL
jgi:hypothetical protein